MQTTVQTTRVVTEVSSGIGSNSEDKYTRLAGGESFPWGSGSVALYLQGAKPGDVYSVDLEVDTAVSSNYSNLGSIQISYLERKKIISGFRKVIGCAFMNDTDRRRTVTERVVLKGKDNPIQVTRGNPVPIIAVIEPIIYGSKGDGIIASSYIRVISITKE